MRISAFIALALGAGLLAGCAGSLDQAAKPRSKPEWVVRGPGAFKNQGGVVYYGLGIANAMPNPALQRKVAETRARESIAATLKTSIQSLVKDFMQNQADYFKPSGEAQAEEVVSTVSLATSDAQLSNCRILDYWEDPQLGTLYALAKLDLNDGFYKDYKENLAKALREGGPGADIQGAQKAVMNLDKEVEVQQGKLLNVLNVTQDAPKIEPMEDPKP